jgi:glycosyltransferase involved in cell wall biosynthesis
MTGSPLISPVHLVFDQRQSTGIGNYVECLNKLITPVFGDPVLHPLNPAYGSNNSSTGSELLIPFAIERAEQRIRRDPDWLDRNVHLCGGHSCLADLGARVVITVHDYYTRPLLAHHTLSPTRILNEGFNRWLHHRAGHSLTRCNAIITPSAHSASQLKSALGIESRVIHHWIDASRFHQRSKVEARRLLGLPENRKLILSIGGDTWNKDIGLVKRVGRSLPPGYTLVRVGSGIGLRDHRVLNLGTVTQERYPWLFNACDVLLHTSLEEGFGYPLIEALGSELPVVAVDRATVPEILGPSPVAVSPNASSLDILEQILSLERQSVLNGVLEYQSVRSKMFSAGLALEKYYEVYKAHFR